MSVSGTESKAAAPSSEHASIESAVLGNWSGILTLSHTSAWNERSFRNDRSEVKNVNNYDKIMLSFSVCSWWWSCTHAFEVRFLLLQSSESLFLFIFFILDITHTSACVVALQRVIVTSITWISGTLSQQTLSSKRHISDISTLFHTDVRESKSLR